MSDLSLYIHIYCNNMRVVKIFILLITAGRGRLWSVPSLVAGGVVTPLMRVELVYTVSSFLEYICQMCLSS